MNHFIQSTLVLTVAVGISAGCASLPENRTTVRAGWRQVEMNDWQRVMVREDVSSTSLDRPRLGKVMLASGLSGESLQEFEVLTGELNETLKEELGPPQTGAVTLNVTLSQPAPVSPLLNLVTMAVVFVPLDNGAFTVEAELVDDRGSQLALWRERVSGDFGFDGSLSGWEKLRVAAREWGQRCAHQPAWLP